MSKTRRPKSDSKSHSKRLKWRAEWLLYTCVEEIAGCLPGSWVFRIGEMLGGIAWHFMPLRRRVVLRNLRIAFYGEYDLPTLQRMARETIRRTGANLFSTAHTARLSGNGPEYLPPSLMTLRVTTSIG